MKQISVDNIKHWSDSRVFVCLEMLVVFDKLSNKAFEQR